MIDHLSIIPQACNFLFHHLASIHGLLNDIQTAVTISAFILSRIDYCCLLLCGCIHDVTFQCYAAFIILPQHTTVSNSNTMPTHHMPTAHSKTFGDRSFSFPPPVKITILRDVGCAPSLSPFMSHFKTHLFHSV